MFRSERRDAGKRHRLAGAAIRDDGTHRQNEALRREEHDRRIAVLVVGGTLTVVAVVVMMRCSLAAVLMMRHRLAVMLMVRGQLRGMLMLRAAGFRANDTASQRIGEVDVVMCVFDLVHERDVGLPGQHHCQRHAEDGDGASEGDVSAEAQLRPRASKGPSLTQSKARNSRGGIRAQGRDFLEKDCRKRD